MRMTYSTGEVAQKLNMSKDGLRYYEKEGLLPPIGRDTSGRRVYTDADVEWIFLIRCLRDTDMPIFKIKQYVSFLMEGQSNTIPERRKILYEHQLFLQEKIVTYQKLLQLIQKKLKFYDDALLSKDVQTIRCMDYAVEWEQFRRLLGGIEYD